MTWLEMYHNVTWNHYLSNNIPVISCKKVLQSLIIFLLHSNTRIAEVRSKCFLFGCQIIYFSMLMRWNYKLGSQNSQKMLNVIARDISTAVECGHICIETLRINTNSVKIWWKSNWCYGPKGIMKYINELYLGHLISA